MSEISKLIREDMLHVRMALDAEERERRSELAAPAGSAIKRELLDWAETLLCNAECPEHCNPEEWRNILKRWRDEKHGVSQNAKDHR